MMVINLTLALRYFSDDCVVSCRQVSQNDNKTAAILLNKDEQKHMAPGAGRENKNIR